ncbi:DUF3593 domain-containing protein [Heliophilum fasciatum]|uniref:Uncharacterized protein DUF3593 n=1 Tax=Heliophilum fasciatum TaxID=35700 RepID=A0A4R2RVF6_9FIRM|nr:DUF3593 domain-containing protein [Heliophilum fasciatum]MCW2277092.1 hypothetical protein [Heliophilum fasciatum]TCP68382.1 uncharacterized protein DUF3593 [Heliophilum fasciatum]
MSSLSEALMTLSIFPYIYFLYVMHKVRKTHPEVINFTTYRGFHALIGFIFFTAGTGFYATQVLGAPTLGKVDWLHGISEAGLTITNGLVLLGLKRQLSELGK